MVNPLLKVPLQAGGTAQAHDSVPLAQQTNLTQPTVPLAEQTNLTQPTVPLAKRGEP